MEHIKLFSGIIAGFTAAVIGVTSVTTNAAIGSTLAKSYKTYSDNLYNLVTELAEGQHNFSDSVYQTIFGRSGSGGHGGGSYTRDSGFGGLSVNAVNDVVNSSDFASDADALLVAYAKASTGSGGSPVVTEITVPTQFDFSGQVFCTGSGGYEELFQFHLVYNGYRYKQGFYPDCAVYFSRIDNNLVEQTYTLFIDPLTVPVVNEVEPISSTTLRLAFKAYYNNAWRDTAISCSVATTNSVEYSGAFNRPGDSWWNTQNDQTPGSRFSSNPKYFFTDAYTNNTTIYNYITGKREAGGSGFSLPVGFAPVAAGVVISADSLVDLGGFSFDSVLGGLTFNMDNAFQEFVDKSSNSMLEQYEDFYSSIAEYGALWNSQERQNYYDLYNYVEPLPPVTGGGGVPDDWLQAYPTVTTAFYIEPYPATLPPSSLPAPVQPISDLSQTVFDASGLASVAVALGLLSVIAFLI